MMSHVTDDRRMARRCHACAEPLERRQLLAATWDEAIPQVVENGFLEIGGRDLPDYVEIGSDGQNLLVNSNGDYRKYVKSSVQSIAVLVGNGNDTVFVGNVGMGIYIEAGNDDDLIVGGDGWDYILGCDGNDTIYGGAGNDYLDGDRHNDLIEGGPGADTLVGDTGYDTVTYASRRERLRLSLDDIANDGAAGESDNLLSFEVVIGGEHHDVIVGDAHSNVLNGGGGNDLIKGGGGNDTLFGGKGRDRLYGEAGNDMFYDRDKAKDMIVGGLGVDRATMDWTDTRREVERLFKMAKKK